MFDFNTLLKVHPASVLRIYELGIRLENRSAQQLIWEVRWMDEAGPFHSAFYASPNDGNPPELTRDVVGSFYAIEGKFPQFFKPLPNWKP